MGTYAVLDRVLARLQGEYDTAGKDGQFTQLSPFITGQTEGLTHKQVAQVSGNHRASGPGGCFTGCGKRYRELLRRRNRPDRRE